MLCFAGCVLGVIFSFQQARDRQGGSIFNRRSQSKHRKDQIELLFIDENESVKSWEYAVLVSNGDYVLTQIG